MKIEDMDKYLNLELKEYKDVTRNYPVGKLGYIEIKFMHYKTFEEAKVK